MWYKLENKVAARCSMLEGAKALDDIDSRRVGLTKVGEYEVSTVFLGLDHNHTGEGAPLLFETMTFGPGDHSGNCERCSTWEQAEAQHARTVAALLEQ